jgi:signal transduction histidine kinase
MVVATRCFGWGHAPKAIADFVAAEMFVVAFAGVVAGERRARADLGDANRKLAEYATQADELATAKERNRLAREIHDSLGHYLTIIHVQLQAAAIQIDRDPDEAKQLLAKAASLTHEGLEDVRRSVAALRASAIHDRPLAAAIADLAAELSTSGTATQFSVSGAPRPLSPAVELTLYRTAQEALTNVRKHAHAANAEVRLEYANGHVHLSVTDDGRLGPASPVLGFGLIGARERARLVGGHLEVGRTPRFTVTVTIPA